MNELTPEQKTYIDSLDVEALLRKVRFAPIGDPMMTGEVGSYFLRKLAEVKANDLGAFVVASKKIGWEKK